MPVPSPLRSIARAALLKGARFSELARMAIADYHRDSGTLLVRTSKAGKLRHIELTAEGLDFFAQITAGRSCSEPPFHRSGARSGKSHQQRPRSEACRAAKINPSASFHILRHTYASLMVIDGVPLMVVARNLGHADTPASTARSWIELRPVSSSMVDRYSHRPSSTAGEFYQAVGPVIQAVGPVIQAVGPVIRTELAAKIGYDHRAPTNGTTFCCSPIPSGLAADLIASRM
jgi:hypothetical protein